MSLSYAEQITHGGPRFTEIPELNIYGNRFVIDFLRKSLEITDSHKIALNEIKEGTKIESNGYRILPIRGNHGPEAGFAHSYVIQKEEKTLLYALDSGTYDEESSN